MDDILRVLNDLHTFTSDDVAEALEMTRSGANYQLDDLLSHKWLERVKSGHNYVYALSDKAKRRIAKLPAINPCERCLLLEVVPQIAIDCPDCAGTVTITYDGSQFQFAKCDYCFARWYRSKYPDGWSEWRIDDIPF